MVEWLRETGTDMLWGPYSVITCNDRENGVVKEVETYEDAKMIVMRNNGPTECRHTQVFLPGHKTYPDGYKITSVCHLVETVGNIKSWKQVESNSYDLSENYNVNADIEETLKLT